MTLISMSNREREKLKTRSLFRKNKTLSKKIKPPP